MLEKLRSPKLVPVAATAVVLLAALVSWFLVVSPQRSRAASLDGKIADKQVELAEAKLQARRIDVKGELAKLRLVQTLNAGYTSGSAGSRRAPAWPTP